MKRSVNFNGFQPKHRNKYNTAQDFVNACRAIGMTDEEIRAAVLKMSEAQKKDQKGNE